MNVNFDEQEGLFTEAVMGETMQRMINAAATEAAGHRMAQDMLDKANKDKPYTIAQNDKICEWLNAQEWPVWLNIYLLSSCIAQQVIGTPPGHPLPTPLELTARVSAVYAMVNSMVVEYAAIDRAEAQKADE